MEACEQPLAPDAAERLLDLAVSHPDSATRADLLAILVCVVLPEQLRPRLSVTLMDALSVAEADLFPDLVRTAAGSDNPAVVMWVRAFAATPGPRRPAALEALVDAGDLDVEIELQHLMRSPEADDRKVAVRLLARLRRRHGAGFSALHGHLALVDTADTSGVLHARVGPEHELVVDIDTEIGLVADIDIDAEAGLVADINTEIGPAAAVNTEVGPADDINTDVRPAADIDAEAALAADINTNIGLAADIGTDVGPADDINTDVGLAAAINTEAALLADIGSEVAVAVDLDVVDGAEQAADEPWRPTYHGILRVVGSRWFELMQRHPPIHATSLPPERLGPLLVDRLLDSAVAMTGMANGSSHPHTVELREWPSEMPSETAVRLARELNGAYLPDRTGLFRRYRLARRGEGPDLAVSAQSLAELAGVGSPVVAVSEMLGPLLSHDPIESADAAAFLRTALEQAAAARVHGAYHAEH